MIDHLKSIQEMVLNHIKTYYRETIYIIEYDYRESFS